MLQKITRRILEALKVHETGLPLDGPRRLSIWLAFSVFIVLLVFGLFYWGTRCAGVKDLVNSVGAAASIGGLILSLVILFWTVLDVLTAQYSVSLSKRHVIATHSNYKAFREHVEHVATFLSASDIGPPIEVTIVTSTLLYGILAQTEQDGKMQQDASTVERFLDLLEGWIHKWKDEKSTGTCVLRICLWPREKHRAWFSVPADIASDNDEQRKFNELRRTYLERLKVILKSIKELYAGGRLAVEFHVTDCDEVRLFLVRGQDAKYRSVLGLVTALDKKSLDSGEVRYLDFSSSGVETYEEYKTFALECCHIGETPKTGPEPQTDPEGFVTGWFTPVPPNNGSSHPVVALSPDSAT